MNLFFYIPLFLYGFLSGKANQDRSHLPLLSSKPIYANSRLAGRLMDLHEDETTQRPICCRSDGTVSLRRVKPHL